MPEFDVVIVGGSFGGCAAALAAARAKHKVVLLAESDWIGGQATSQGVTRWDEAAAELTESTGSSVSYRRLRDLIRARYPDAERSPKLGQLQTYFNPGFAGVGPPFTTMCNPPLFRRGERRGHPFAADPMVVRAVLESLLDEAGVTVERGAVVERADVDGGTVRSLTVRLVERVEVYSGLVFLDATDLGDLLVHCGVPWVIGAEAQHDTHENDAPAGEHPEWIQPITVPIAVEWSEKGQPDAGDPPPGYSDIRAHQGFDRLMRPTGDPRHPQEGDGGISVVFDPGQEEDTMINYRQFIDPANFVDQPAYRTTINVGSNDYLAQAIPSDPRSTVPDTAVIEAARAVSRAYVYYLQHDVPRHFGSHETGFPEIKIDPKTFGTADGTAPDPYIRESRRLANPHARVVQQDIDAASNGGNFSTTNLVNQDPPGLGSRSRRAKSFPDSCGIGWYNVDVHKGYYSRSGQPGDAEKPNIGTEWHGFGTVPFQIPLGALLPHGFTNFVASCKNIGTTHLTSGAYRVHPVEWAIGEAAGTLAAYCVERGIAPSDVDGDPDHRTAFQLKLIGSGVPIFWWDDVRYEHDAEAFAAIQLLGVRRIFEGDGETRNFHPDDPFPDELRAEFDNRLNHVFQWPAPNPAGQKAFTRRDAAKLICRQLGLVDA